MSQPALLTYDPSVWLLLLSDLCCLSPPHIRGKMASGIKVTDGVKSLFCEMKVCPKDKSQIRLAIFTIKDGKIDTELSITDDDLCKACPPIDPFEKLCELAKEKFCLYFLYDCHFETTEGHTKEDLVFGSWVSEECGIKDRMIYSSSRPSVKKCFDGIKHSLELCDKSCLSSRAAFAEALEKSCSTIRSIEGKPVKPDFN